MARSKNATALFEVIHTAKRPPKASPSGGGVPTPKWWAKGSKAGDAAAASRPDAADEAADVSPPEPSSGTRRSWLSAARRPAEVPPPTAVEPAEYDNRDERDDPQADRHGPSDDHGEDFGADHDPDGDSRVVITRVYPPGAPELPVPDDVSGHGPESDIDDETCAPRPSARAEETADRTSWAERRAKVLAEREAAERDAPPPRPAATRPAATRPAPPSSSSSFDPTANVSPADLRAERRAKWAATESRVERPAPPVEADEQPRRPRRSAGPRPSALKPDVDPIVALDRSAGEVRVRLSYGGAVAVGVIVLVVLVIAYLAGIRSGATGTESMADAPPTMSARSPAVAQTSGEVAAAAPSPMMAAAAGPASAPPAELPASSPAARQPGMLYVVAHSYMSWERDTADRAAAFLTTNGYPATVVPGLSGVAMRDWWSVVCLRPFPQTPRPDLRSYLAGITALGPKFSSRRFEQFDKPQPYVWRADSDAPVQPQP